MMSLQHLTFPGAYAAHLQLRKNRLKKKKDEVRKAALKHTFYPPICKSMSAGAASTQRQGNNDSALDLLQIHAPLAGKVSGMPGEISYDIQKYISRCCHLFLSHATPPTAVLSDDIAPHPSSQQHPVGFARQIKYPTSYYWEGRSINIHEWTFRYWTVTEPRQQIILLVTKHAFAIGGAFKPRLCDVINIQ